MIISLFDCLARGISASHIGSSNTTLGKLLSAPVPIIIHILSSHETTSHKLGTVTRHWIVTWFSSYWLAELCKAYFSHLLKIKRHLYTQRFSDFWKEEYFPEIFSLPCMPLLLTIHSFPSFDKSGRLPYSFHMGLSLLCFNCREIYYFIWDTKPLVSAGNKKMMPQSLLLSYSEKI